MHNKKNYYNPYLSISTLPIQKATLDCKRLNLTSLDKLWLNLTPPVQHVAKFDYLGQHKVELDFLGQLVTEHDCLEQHQTEVDYLEQH
ncbi:hypothetical protein E2542_SST16740 [Spatholobus suberectus]|nr:hypothetical protein E2542_SST16740 [Spatholobus suberectus]